MRREQRGFSLIELLIVVAIILVITAIAIPNFLRSRESANQASAIETLRIIGTAEVSYSTTYGTGFSASLSMLGPPAPDQPTTSTASGLIDEVLAIQNDKSGYSFVYTPTTIDGGSIDGYNVFANPDIYGQTGGVYYFSDQSFVIRANATTTAGSTDVSVGD